MNIPESYICTKVQPLEDIGSVGYLLRHRKTNARVMLIETKDDNKVFSIGFRTTPTDSTGVPHIMEHSVLCGSEKFPLKDPFVELCKGSLNTYLNAETWPDKTLYPVASRNAADFKNLMAVYMDAVFHPNALKEEKIFRQEGWHYEMADENEPITYNGIVYNEMRGAFSDSDTILETEISKNLFPGTTYSVVSGGDPDVIPSLTYEAFSAFHKRYYHPSNSYIYLYGDLDFTERLEWLDKEYLCQYEGIDPQTEIVLPEGPFTGKDCEASYNISEGEEEEAIFSYAWAVGDLCDPVKALSYQVISYALLNAPGAPLKKALLDNGIGTNIYGGYDSSYACPVFTVTCKGGKKEDYPKFREIVQTVLREQAEKGIPKRTLKAGIHSIEFALREADYGYEPTGLAYCHTVMEEWLHTDEAAFIGLQYTGPFTEIKEKVETDFFEKLVTDGLIDNAHFVTVLLTGKEGITAAKDEAIRAKLAAFKESLSAEERAAIIRETKALKAYQSEKDSEEDIRKVPLLSLSDIEPAVEKEHNERRILENFPLLIHDYETNGIGYLDIRFSLKNVDLADFPYVSLLRRLYTAMDTENYTYAALTDEIGLYTGGLGAGISILTNDGYNGEITEQLSVTCRYLQPMVKDSIRLLGEVFLTTRLDDAKRLKEIIAETKDNLEDSLLSAGHATSRRRMLAYEGDASYENELLDGISFYRFLNDLDQNFEERKEELIRKLKELSAKIICGNDVWISFTGNGTLVTDLQEELPLFLRKLKPVGGTPGDRTRALLPVNEGIKTSSMVQYVSKGGFFTKHGDSYDGAFMVLSTIMRYEYLWLNLRVKGGAYGCMSFFNTDGTVAFSSYRDPHVKNTLAVYDKIPEYVSTLELSERDLVKYIIGTMGGVDMPVQPYVKGTRDFERVLRGITVEERQKIRSEILHCTVEKLRALGPIIQRVLEDDRFCAVGSEGKLKEDGDVFQTVATLKN